MDLIDITTVGWPIPWKGRTYQLRPYTLASRARLNQVLRVHYLTEADDQEQALAEIRTGAADIGSRWAENLMMGWAGLLLTLYAALSVQHPDLTLNDAADMLADQPTRDQILMTLRVMAPERPEPRDAKREAVDWHDAIRNLLHHYPQWTFDDVSRLTNAQINLAFEAVNNAAIADGGYTLDDIEPLPPEGDSHR